MADRSSHSSEIIRQPDSDVDLYATLASRGLEILKEASKRTIIPDRLLYWDGLIGVVESGWAVEPLFTIPFWIFDLAGTFIRKIELALDPVFRQPEGILFGERRDLSWGAQGICVSRSWWVEREMLRTVQVFSPDGESLASWSHVPGLRRMVAGGEIPFVSWKGGMLEGESTSFAVYSDFESWVEAAQNDGWFWSHEVEIVDFDRLVRDGRGEFCDAVNGEEKMLALHWKRKNLFRFPIPSSANASYEWRSGWSHAVRNGDNVWFLSSGMGKPEQVAPVPVMWRISAEQQSREPDAWSLPSAMDLRERRLLSYQADSATAEEIAKEAGISGYEAYKRVLGQSIVVYCSYELLYVDGNDLVFEVYPTDQDGEVEEDAVGMPLHLRCTGDELVLIGQLDPFSNCIPLLRDGVGEDTLPEDIVDLGLEAGLPLFLSFLKHTAFGQGELFSIQEDPFRWRDMRISEDGWFSGDRVAEMRLREEKLWGIVIASSAQGGAIRAFKLEAIA